MKIYTMAKISTHIGIKVKITSVEYAGLSNLNWFKMYLRPENIEIYVGTCLPTLVGDT